MIIPFILKYPVPVKLFSYDKCELNQKWPIYLSGMKFSKILLLCAVFLATTAQAENYPKLNEDGEFSLMGALADHGLHDLQDERWNVYSQGTYISTFKD